MSEDDGVVYGIRPHLPQTEEQLAERERMYRAIPITDPWLLAMVRKTIIIAGRYRSARLYVQHAQIDPGTVKIITDPDRLRAYDPRSVKITVVDDGGRLGTPMFDQLTLLEGWGAEVTWVDLDKIMGVER